jgi:hypothetical protein
VQASLMAAAVSRGGGCSSSSCMVEGAFGAMVRNVL